MNGEVSNPALSSSVRTAQVPASGREGLNSEHKTQVTQLQKISLHGEMQRVMFSPAISVGLQELGSKSL